LCFCVLNGYMCDTYHAYALHSEVYMLQLGTCLSVFPSSVCRDTRCYCIETNEHVTKQSTKQQRIKDVGGIPTKCQRMCKNTCEVELLHFSRYFTDEILPTYSRATAVKHRIIWQTCCHDVMALGHLLPASGDA